jgi:hypothetical protein
MADKGTDLVKFEKYAVAQADTANLMETIRANIGGAQLSEFDLDRVKIPAGGGRTWEVPTLEGVESMQELQGVIVFWKDTRAFWEKSFDQVGGGNPPDCSSPNAELALAREGVTVPAQLTESGHYACATCRYAEFGTDPREGSNAQACKLVRQMFLLTPDDLIPLVVSLPPTSVGTAQKYFLRLARAGVPYYGVQTKIGLEQTTAGSIKYSKATFSMANRLEGDEAAVVAAYAAEMRPAFERVQAQATDLGAQAPGDPVESF